MGKWILKERGKCGRCQFEELVLKIPGLARNDGLCRARNDRLVCDCGLIPKGHSKSAI